MTGSICIDQPIPNNFKSTKIIVEDTKGIFFPIEVERSRNSNTASFRGIFCNEEETYSLLQVDFIIDNEKSIVDYQTKLINSQQET